MPRLLLVRHGESTWNAESRLQGQADPPLSERGRAQAAALAGRLPAFEAERVVCSDLLRASETAALLGWPDAEADARWREIDLGEWTGRPSAEVRAEDGDAFRAWRQGRRPAPGGESYEDFAARVEAAGRELLGGGDTAGAAVPGATVLVVTHGGPIRVLCAVLLGVELRRLGGVGNGSATVVEAAPGGPRLVAYNLGGAGGEDL